MFAAFFEFMRKFFGLFTHTVDMADRGLGVGDLYLTSWENSAKEEIELAEIEKKARLAKRRAELEQE